MQGTRILLARHAETSAPDRFHGAESDIGLSDWGPSRPSCSADRSRTRAEGPLLLGDAPGDRYGGADRPRLRAGADRHRDPARAPDRPPERGLARGRLGDLCRVQARWIAGDLEVTHPGGESFADIRRRVGPDLAGAGRASSRRDDRRRGPRRGDPRGARRAWSPASRRPTSTGSRSTSPRSTTSGSTAVTWTARALNQVVAPSPARPVA